MNIVLQNSGLLGLGLLVAAPILIHLFVKTRPPKLLFSATDFVAKVVVNTLRIKRPKDWLLLILRTLLFMMLALLFLRPLLFSKGVPEENGKARTMILLIDRSASMAWTEGGQSRFSAACAEGAELLDGLSAQDIANVIWIDAQPDPVLPELSANKAYLRKRLSETRVSSESGDVASAIELALKQFGAGTQKKELCIISDFQISQWKGVSKNLPDDIEVYTVWPVKEDGDNGAVLSIQTQPASPLVGDQVQVTCEVANYSPKPKSRTITIQMDEKRLTKQIMIPAWARATTVVEHVFRAGGGKVISATLNEDQFGYDDWYGTVISVKDALKVGIAGNDEMTAPIWRRALNALNWIDASMVNLNQPNNLSEYDLLMLSGWDGKQTELLVDLNTNGIPIICSPAIEIYATSLAALAGQGGVENLQLTLQKMDKAISMKVTQPDHPVFNVFKDGNFGDPAQAAVRIRPQMDLSSLSGTALLAYDDGQPALYECAGEVPVIFWLALLNAGSSDWASQMPFLPFFGELISATCSKTPQVSDDTVYPGEMLSWSAPVWTEQVSLKNRADQHLTISRSDSRDTDLYYISEPIEAPGQYTWYLDNHLTSVQMVNFPTQESDLRTEMPALNEEGAVLALTSSAELQTVREGKPIWKTMIWLALLFAVAESAIVFLSDVESRKMAGESS